MVDHQIIICNIPFIYPGEIKDSAKRHVWIKSALMLIQIHGSADQKGHIIFHGQIKDIFQCIYLQVIRILIVRVVDRIIKLQQIFFVIKDHSP